MNIYIVMGQCGEHGDHSEWPVAAFFSEDKAREHAANAKKRAIELYTRYASSKRAAWSTDYEYDWEEGYTNIPRGANEFDPAMQTDYTGTSYFVYTVPLKDSGENTGNVDCPPTG